MWQIDELRRDHCCETRYFLRLVAAWGYFKGQRDITEFKRKDGINCHGRRVQIRPQRIPEWAWNCLHDNSRCGDITVTPIRDRGLESSKWASGFHWRRATGRQPTPTYPSHRVRKVQLPVSRDIWCERGRHKNLRLGPEPWAFQLWLLPDDSCRSLDPWDGVSREPPRSYSLLQGLRQRHILWDPILAQCLGPWAWEPRTRQRPWWSRCRRRIKC